MILIVFLNETGRQFVHYFLLMSLNAQFLKHMGQLVNISTLATDEPLYELKIAA